jgi:hypothetical protein
MSNSNNIKQNYNPNSFNDEHIEIEDTDNWNSNPLGIKELALRQFHDCQKAGSKELNPGGIRRIMYNGRLEELVEPDTGQIFTNHVRILQVTLKAQIENKKKEMQLDWLEYNNEVKKVKELKNKYDEHIKELISLPAYKRCKINISHLAQQYERDIYMKEIELSFILLEKLSTLMHLHNYFNEGEW